MKAIILAGGLGTRLRPLTENMPKPLLPVKGRPMVEYAIENFRRHGVRDIVLSIGYMSDKIRDYFGGGDKFGVNISYSIEDEPLGTGGAIKKASAGLTEPVFVTWGDNLMDVDYSELNKVFNENRKTLAMVLTPREDVENFGVVKLDGNIVTAFVEKPKRELSPSNLINAGAIILNPSKLSIIPQGKSSIEYDFYEKLAPGEIIAFIHRGQWYPTDTLEKYRHAEENFKPPEK